MDSLSQLSHEQIIRPLELDYFGQTIPEPNVIPHGNNVQLIFLLEPEPYKAAKMLWKAITIHRIDKLKEFGAESNCKDFARVMRLSGTWHKEGMSITADYRHSYRYSLRELQESYLKDLDKDWKEQKTERLKKKRAKRMYSSAGKTRSFN